MDPSLGKKKFEYKNPKEMREKIRMNKKRKEIKMTKKKKKKKLYRVRTCLSKIQKSLWCSHFLSIFLSNLRRLHFGGSEKKTFGPTNFSSPLPSQPNNTKSHFLLPFFYPPSNFFQSNGLLV